MAEDQKTRPFGNGAANRTDFVVISEMVAKSTRVLDVGCHDGALLAMLTDSHGIDGRGIELAQEDVNACVAKGLSVIQGDANKDLRDYPDQAFDYVILSQAIQALRDPAEALQQMLRIGKRAIISFPNFGYWQVRAYLAFLGRMPVTETMPHTWYETPNVHYCTIRDFAELCQALDVTIERAVALDVHGKALNLGKSLWWANVLGEQAVFLLRR